MFLWDLLVDKPTKHKIDILMTINRFKRVSLERICEITGLDRRTVARYFDDILFQYHELREEGEVSFELKRESNGEIGLEYVNYKSFQVLVMTIIEQNITIDLLKRLLLGDKVHLMSYSDEHFISLSTIKRRLSQVRNILTMYHLRIKNKNGIIEIAGEEKQIRLLAYSFFWLFYKGGVWPFSTITKEKTSAIRQIVYGEAIKKWSFTNSEQILTVIAINVIRYRKGYTVSFEYDWLDDEYFEPKRQVFAELAENFLLSKEEVIFLMLIIQTQEKYYLDNQVRKDILQYHEKRQTSLLRATKRYLDLYSERVYPLTEEDRNKYFFNLLGNHLYSSLFHPFPIAIGSFTFSDKYLQRYPVLLKKIEEIWNILREEINAPFLENRGFLFARYLLLSSVFHPLTLFEKPITILLETDMPWLAEKNIADQLTNHFQNQYKFKIISRREMTSEMEVDLVISNNFLSELEYVGSPSMLLYIEDELQTDDFYRIEQKLMMLDKQL